MWGGVFQETIWQGTERLNLGSDAHDQCRCGLSGVVEGSIVSPENYTFIFRTVLFFHTTQSVNT
jgi:hypothetical protein